MVVVDVIAIPLPTVATTGAPSKLVADSVALPPAQITAGVAIAVVMAGLGLEVTLIVVVLAQPVGPDTPSLATTV